MQPFEFSAKLAPSVIHACLPGGARIKKMQGYIKLHRQIIEHELWLSEPFTKSQAWVDLLLLANHKDGLLIIRGNYIPVKRGQVGWSATSLSKRWKWGRTRTENFIKYLKNQHQIVQQKNPVFAPLSIVNYDKYQGDQHADQHADVHQTNIRPTTNKNGKNDKNINTFRKSEKSDKEEVSSNEFNQQLVEKMKNELLTTKEIRLKNTTPTLQWQTLATSWSKRFKFNEQENAQLLSLFKRFKGNTDYVTRLCTLAEGSRKPIASILKQYKSDRDNSKNNKSRRSLKKNLDGSIDNL